MMEKNGNTVEPGDFVSYSSNGDKTAGASDLGQVVTVDADQETALVKFAAYEKWVPISQLVRQ